MGLILIGARLGENGYYLSNTSNGIRVEMPNGEIKLFDNEIEFAQWSTLELYNFEIPYEE